jgi:uncharacterized protein (DUF1800 family)
VATRAQLAHLLRRATFGPTADEVDAAERVGFDTTLTGLLSPTTPDAGAAGTPMPHFADPLANLARGADQAIRRSAQQELRRQTETSVVWWLDRMVAADRQFAEKLVFFWHGHWATSVLKVRSAVAMLRQQQTFRDLGAGDFGPFLKAMLRDPALIFWLDGQQNVRTAPNENLARESMELFTLGIGGGYTEADVRAAARALTGWQLRRGDATATVNPARHDDGVKTILGQTGRYDTDGYADLLLAAPAHPGFLASRLWYRFGSGAPIPADTRNRLAAAYQPGRDVTDLARALFTDPAFAGTAGQLVKQPVEWAAGALRQLGIRPAKLPADAQQQLAGGISALGQTLFRPPSVGGWPAGAAWLTTSATEYRIRAGTFLAQHASPEVIDRLANTAAKERIDALARLLVVDGFTDRSRAVLATAGQDPRALLALGLASPEYAIC